MKTILTAFLLLLAGVTFGQTAAQVTEKIVKLAPRSMVKYPVKEKRNVYFLETGFNDAIFKNQSLLKELSGKVILKAELVYTTYHKSETFDQHALNRKRLKALFSLAPNSLKQPGIDWILIAQTGCTSAEMGKEFFHGVVITVRESASDLPAAEENFIRSVASGKIPVAAYDSYLKNNLTEKVDSSAVSAPAALPTLPEFKGGERARIDYFTRNLRFPTGVSHGPSQKVAVQFSVDKNGNIGGVVMPGVVNPNPYHQEVKNFLETMPKWKPGTVDGKPVDCVIRMVVDFMDRGTVAAGPLEIYAAGKDPGLPEKAADYSKVPVTAQSRTVAETLEKNNWANSVIVADVTGSMASYNAQVMLYIKSKLDKKDKSVLRVVFFNDGDDKKDSHKKAGSTGGIYSFVPKNFDDLVEQLAKAMKKGNGGDLAENNVEALIEAQKDSPEAENLILIADNPATPRDMHLIAKVTKPVHVIVCGFSTAINPAWLDIARMTRGSVEFMGRSYTKLESLDEGGKVKIGQMGFVLRAGKFEDEY